MKEKLEKTLSQVKKFLAKEKVVIAAYLYGSQTTNKASQESDVDIALLLKPQAKLSLKKILKIAAEIEKITQIRPLDIRILNEMPLHLQGEILRKGTLIYSSNERLRVDFEVKIINLYFDYLPYLKRIRRKFLEKVASEGLL